MTASIDLPSGNYRLREPVAWPHPPGPPANRVVYAAAHVVADPMGDNTPGSPAAVDWETTLRFRRHLWSYGLRVADAMDTAQRNNGLDWAATRELIRLSAAAARDLGDPADLIACGAGTDHVPGARTPQAIEAAYQEQIAAVQESGATVILMASRQLAAITHAPEDYQAVYGKLLAEVERPAILHWLGEMFDPNLAGYWGSRNIEAATTSFLELIHANAPKIDGVKVSLLDESHEVRLRAALPEGVRLYTGDDFNYPSLIKSGSHALLGIFDAIAPAAAAAFQALDAAEGPHLRRHPAGTRPDVLDRPHPGATLGPGDDPAHDALGIGLQPGSPEKAGSPTGTSTRSPVLARALGAPKAGSPTGTRTPTDHDISEISASAADLMADYDRILAPTVALSRKIFEAPTFHYKTGIVFLAWLNGHQDAFTMVNGAQSARSLSHLAEVFRLADQAGLLADPELAVSRMRAFLAVHGR
ncbi:hypothetical protein Aple_079090 [Acrocarpospora pleiomorpha]|uniref:Dihydrodipicolinate synthase family protein n=1 Tax=Acrocarpospora pleiomorpha TaxID=90975 RepID=A0A5M3XVR7_9ACTN|nr:DUF993 family protein [Acrocarpospora pleiomorpha]GES25010.1 hypothetical protein Aple_079090 [Acrocarpospora pleiomorpha]